VSPAGAVFQPDLIELMKLVLDDVTAMLPEAKRTSTIKAEIASKILAYAARGERDPIAMRKRVKTKTKASVLIQSEPNRL
jgi:hypothetical protein